MLFPIEMRQAAVARFESIFPELTADLLDVVMLYAVGVNIRSMRYYSIELGERSAKNKLKKSLKLLGLTTLVELRAMVLIRLSLLT